MSNVFLIGNGAREHAIAEAILRSRHDPVIFSYMKSNNPGIAALSEKILIGDYNDLKGIKKFSRDCNIDFAVIGPEDLLNNGVVDSLREIDMPCVGPTKSLSRLETSKSFTRRLIQKYNIPGNPIFRIFSSMEGIDDFLGELVIYDDRTVAIYYDNIRIVQHKRIRIPNDYTTLPAHMPPEHRNYAEWSPERFIKWGQSIGDNVAEMIRFVLKSKKHPEQAFKTCMGILNLVKEHGSDRLNKACGRALGFGFHSYRRIKNILDRGLEEEKIEGSMELPVSSHENIRGSQYYI